MNRLTSFSFSFLLILFIACKGDRGPTGPQGTLLTGNLIGYVFLYDETGQRLVDRSGVTVSIDALSRSATSDVSGRWTITNLNTGTYTVAFRKSGFSTFKIPSLQFVGGGDVYTSEYAITALPSFSVTNIAASVSSTEKLINVTGIVSSGRSPQRTILLLYGDSPQVRSDPPSYLFVSYAQTIGDSTVFAAPLYAGNLNQAGVASGATVYIRAYAASNYWLGYTDPSSGKIVYCGIDTVGSNIVSVVVP